MFSNIGKSDFSKTMSDYDLQYGSLVRQAERLRRNNENTPSVDEARLYEKASIVCDKIIALSSDTPNIKMAWINRKTECLDNMEKIVTVLQASSEKAKSQAETEKAAVINNTNTNTNDAAVNKSDAVKTASGFTTKNACKDVPAENIEKWYHDAPDIGFNDAVGMSDIKAELNRIIGRIGYEKLLKHFNLKCSKNFLFYGPTGSGKTFIINAFISELMRETNFKFIYLTPADISSSLVGVAEKIVQAAFREAIDNSPCIIFIDEIDVICGDRNNPQLPAHQKNLTVAFLNALNEVKGDKNVIFLAATNHPGNIDEAMLNRLDSMFSVPFPDEEARYLFFKKAFEQITLTEGLSLEYISEITSGYSYRDLTNLSEYILGSIVDEAITKFANLNSDGKDIDKDATIERAIEEDENGNSAVELSFDKFEEYRCKKPPTLKEKMQNEFEEFEKKIGGLIL